MTQPQLLAQAPVRFFEGFEALAECCHESQPEDDRVFSLVCLRWTCCGYACRSSCPYDSSSGKASPVQ
jgi:hypothetical protein